MKIILQQDIRSLGKKGEIKDVNDGYAFHFLFPKKLARLATAQNIALMAKQKEMQQKKYEKEIALLKKQVKKLQFVVLEIKEKASKEGKLFAQITTDHIAKELRIKGFSVEKKHITLPTQIKEVGDYVVTITYGNAVPTVDIKVKVLPKNR